MFIHGSKVWQMYKKSDTRSGHAAGLSKIDVICQVANCF